MEGQEQNAPAPQQSQQASPAPASQPEFKVPDGHRIVREDEYGTLSRYKQQYEGSKPLLDAALKAGFKEPGAFDDVSRLSGLVTRGGFKSIGDFAKVFEGTLAEESQPEKQQGFDIESLRQQGIVDKESLEEMFASKERLWEAKSQHKSDMKEQESRIKSAVDELTKGAASNRDKYLIAQAFKNVLYDHADFYGDDHPLAGTQTVRPFTDAEIKQAVTEIQKQLNVEEAGEIEELAQAAAKKAPPKPPAGSSGGSGKPEKAEGRRSMMDGIRNTPIPKRGQPTA